MNFKITVSVYFITSLLAIGLISPGHATTLHVSPGTDTTIQDMIDAAEEGDTVLVVPGTYKGEGNRDLDFHGKDILLFSEAGPEATILDCENLGRGFHMICGESPAAVISGLTIQNTSFADKGGCMFIENSSPTVENCIIRGGASQSGGAGIHLKWSSSTIDNCLISNCDGFVGGGGAFSGYGSNVFTQCIFVNNTGCLNGAGLLCYYTVATVTHCIIMDNIVDSYDGDAQGGGVYSYSSNLILDHCKISNNKCEGGWIAWIEGGGIYCEGGTANISDCQISDNYVVDGPGGGAYFYSTNTVIISGCEISRNTATVHSGGGIVLGKSNGIFLITDCLFISNFANSSGGGLFLSGGPVDQILRCTFLGNRVYGLGGGIMNSEGNLMYENLIMRDNFPDQIHVSAGAPQIDWSNIEDGWPGEGNIDEDPLFVAPEYDDYRLLWGSPCIDSGNPDSLDLDDTRSDIGAYSFDQSKELIVYLSPETREIEPGETGCVQYTVCNAHPVEKSFVTAAGVRRPDGSPWPGNPLEEPYYTSITPSSNLTSEFEYRVPFGWIPGTYALAAGVGYYGKIYDLDHFEFTVVE